MLKDGVGLPDPQSRKPQPLGAEHLPVVAANGDATILISMGDVRNVNRLAPQQVLYQSDAMRGPDNALDARSGAGIAPARLVHWISAQRLAESAAA